MDSFVSENATVLIAPGLIEQTMDEFPFPSRGIRQKRENLFETASAVNVQMKYFDATQAELLAPFAGVLTNVSPQFVYVVKWSSTIMFGEGRQVQRRKRRMFMDYGDMNDYKLAFVCGFDGATGQFRCYLIFEYLYLNNVGSAPNYMVVGARTSTGQSWYHRASRRPDVGCVMLNGGNVYPGSWVYELSTDMNQIPIIEYLPEIQTPQLSSCLFEGDGNTVPILLLETGWNGQADFQISFSDGVCSQQKIPLSNNFTIFQTTVQSVYLCRNGYISLSEETPPELTQPSDLNDVVSFVIVAPGLLDSFDQGGSPLQLERSRRNIVSNIGMNNSYSTTLNREKRAPDLLQERSRLGNPGKINKQRKQKQSLKDLLEKFRTKNSQRSNSFDDLKRQQPIERKNDNQFNKRQRRQAVETEFVGFRYLTGESLARFWLIDPFFNPTMGFAVRWQKSSSLADFIRMRRQLSELGN